MTTMRPPVRRASPGTVTARRRRRRRPSRGGVLVRRAIAAAFLLTVATRPASASDARRRACRPERSPVTSTATARPTSSRSPDDDLLRVRLGSGGTVPAAPPGPPAPRGTGGRRWDRDWPWSSRGVGTDHSREWTAWQLVRRPVPDLAAGTRGRGRASADEPGSSTAWVAGHRLYDGTLDPLQHGARTGSRSWLARWSLQRGRADRSTRAGVRCWDRARRRRRPSARPARTGRTTSVRTATSPRCCRRCSPAWADRSSTSFGDGSGRCATSTRTSTPRRRRTTSPTPSTGVTHTARVPVGWAPRPVRPAGPARRRRAGGAAQPGGR